MDEWDGKQRREKKKYIIGQMTLFGADDVIGFGTDNFYIKEVSREMASEIIIQNHYSKKIYTASIIHLGVYSAGELVGVLQYGYAMNPNSMASVVKNTMIDEYLELNRMWFIDSSGKNDKSRAISFSIKFIKRKYPKIKWIQSFADERCHKYGIVYQAANFIYCGGHSSIFWELDGIYYHNSLMTRNPEMTPAAKFIQENKSKTKKHTFRQFRYIFFIKNVKRDLLLKVEKYPKHYTVIGAGDCL
jgi:adenine modification enzyme